MLENKENLYIFFHTISGAAAAAVSTLLVYPIENIKIRMQNISSELVRKPLSFQKVPSESEFNNESYLLKSFPQKLNLKKNRDVFNIIKLVYKDEGFYGFYKGVIPSLIGNSISYGLYFFWYEFFKVLFKEEPQNLMKLCKIALFSGVITTTLVNPFWVLHSKMTVKKNPLDLKATIQKIVHNEGFGSLFKGLTASLILVLNPIIQFIIYEILKRKLRLKKNDVLRYFIIAGASKLMATIITYPYQVIRTNMHLSKNENEMSLKKVIERIYKTLGGKGFFQGLIPILSQTVLNSAIFLMLYEKIFRVFQLFVRFILNRKTLYQVKHIII